MPVILHIETSTPVCSAALSKDGELLISKENLEGQSHAEKLGVFVHEIINFAKKNSIVIQAISISSGPGSYTGLRIGVSEAKGLAYGLDVPLIGLPTLTIMAHSQKKNVDKKSLLCPMIDARRMEVYAAVFDTSMHVIQPTEAKIIDTQSFSDFLEKQPIVFFGNGAPKCRHIITHPNAIFLDDVYPEALQMVGLAEKEFSKKNFVNVAYFEPFYLKDFVATKPKDLLKKIRG